MTAPVPTWHNRHRDKRKTKQTTDEFIPLDLNFKFITLLFHEYYRNLLIECLLRGGVPWLTTEPRCLACRAKACSYLSRLKIFELAGLILHLLLVWDLAFKVRPSERQKEQGLETGCRSVAAPCELRAGGVAAAKATVAVEGGLVAMAAIDWKSLMRML